MVDYNDGKWHGWNGGECPVHPHTEVLYQLAACSRVEVDRRKDDYTDKSMFLEWDSNGENWSIVAFRVVKEHIEPPKPREFWIDAITGEAYQYIMVSSDSSRIIHVREVM